MLLCMYRRKKIPGRGHSKGKFQGMFGTGRKRGLEQSERERGAEETRSAGQLGQGLMGLEGHSKDLGFLLSMTGATESLNSGGVREGFYTCFSIQAASLSINWVNNKQQLPGGLIPQHPLVAAVRIPPVYPGPSFPAVSCLGNPYLERFGREKKRGLEETAWEELQHLCSLAGPVIPHSQAESVPSAVGFCHLWVSLRWGHCCPCTKMSWKLHGKSLK